MKGTGLMSEKEKVFKNALTGKKLPILTLDNKWHMLFDGITVPSRIKSLEAKLNELVKREGKINTEGKDIVKIKRKLMDEVIHIADGIVQNPDDKKLLKDREEHKRLIEECNDKIAGYEVEKVKLPGEIEKVNKQLMLESMELCYKKIQENEREIAVLDDWISNTRRELKKKLVRKQEAEDANNKLYSYMHDVFGAEVLEIFDMKYKPDINKKEDSEKKAAEKNQSKNKRKYILNDAPES